MRPFLRVLVSSPHSDHNDEQADIEAAKTVLFLLAAFSMNCWDGEQESALLVSFAPTSPSMPHEIFRGPGSGAHAPDPGTPPM